MKEIINQTAAVWNSFWGESHFWLLFLLCLIYLLIFHRKKPYFRFLAGYLTIVLLVFWCPLTEKIMIRFIGDTFWRLLWLVPVFPVMALTFTELLSGQKKKGSFFLVFLLLLVTIGLTGRDYWTQEYVYSYGNRQKVPDAAAFICETIKADAAKEEIMAAVDNRYAPYIRVYDASLKMPFGRNCRGSLTGNSRRLYLAMSEEIPSAKKVSKYARRLGCNYLVVRIYEEEDLAAFEKNGYEMLGETGVYKILKYKKEKESGYSY